MLRRQVLKNAGILGASAICAPYVRAAKQPIVISTLPVPSLGYFLPPIIKTRKLDAKHGIDIKFQQKPTGTARTDFAAGTDKLIGSGTLLADVAKLNLLGVKTVFLFNVFDYWGTVAVRKDSDIETLKDLNGKTIAAGLATTSYVMFRYFAKMAGLNINSIKPINTDTPGMVPMMLSGRVDGVQMWEPAFSILQSKSDAYKALPMVDRWKEYSGEKALPYLGVAAHADWLESNKEDVIKLYNTYSDAARVVREDPEGAASIIGDATKIPVLVIRELLRSPRLGINIYWSGDQADAIKSVINAGKMVGYLKSDPGAKILYRG